MAYEGILNNIPGLTASADLSSYQYCPVKISGDKTITRAVLATDLVIGVLQNKPTLGQAATIAGPGSVSKVRAGASITAGNKLAADASSQAEASTTATDWAFGIALESITLAATPTVSELVTALITGPFHPANAS